MAEVLNITNLTLQDMQKRSYLVAVSNTSSTGQVVLNPDGTSILGSAFSGVNGWLNVNLATALSSLIDTIAAYDTTDGIMNATSLLTPQFGTIVVSASGVTNLVAAVSTKKIRVLGFVLTANAAVNVKFQSHVTPTDITGLHYLAQNSIVTVPYNPKGWFQTIAGEALDINLSGNVAVGGYFLYVTL